MTEPNQPKQSWALRLLKASPYADLPWEKVFTKKIVACVVAPLALLGLYVLPGIFAAGKVAAAQGGILLAFLKTSGALLALGCYLAIQTFIFLYFIAVMWAVLPLVPKAVKAVLRFLWKLPGYLASLPGRIANSTAEERLQAGFMAVAGGLFALVVYFGWGTASGWSTAFLGWLSDEPTAVQSFPLTMMLLLWGWVMLLYCFVIPLALLRQYLRSR
ncbi:MAG: hypothetical protein K2W82_17630 [Candidatus Obscuribacterales bacterium]|jgi:hypothetical protein|nr:hypothetical protein [Candidatus Obscuribacterales bacterium]